jgi:hypothetical protein
MSTQQALHSKKKSSSHRLAQNPAAAHRESGRVCPATRQPHHAHLVHYWLYYCAAQQLLQVAAAVVADAYGPRLALLV